MAAAAIMGRVAPATATGLDLHSPPRQSALGDSQRKLIAQLAELIIPATDTPGAIEAGVPAFIDQIVSHWYTAAERGIFLEGCAGLEKICVSRFKQEFICCSALQQTQALQSAEEEASSYQPAPGQGLFGPFDEQSPFFFKLRQLTVLGYYTSQTGATTESNITRYPGGTTVTSISTPSAGSGPIERLKST